MLILTDKADKTAQDIKTLSLLMKAEQAAEKAQEARAKVMNLIGVSLEIGNFCTLSTLFNQFGYVSD